jgi:2-iminoacetate synthase ThiH
MEENVVSSAGTTHRATIADMERSILDAGYLVRRRRQDYSMIEPEPVAA